MKLHELTKYSRALLKHKRITTIMVCILPFLPEVFFRSAEATVYSLLLYMGEMQPAELFSGGNAIQLTVCIFIILLRWFTTAPLVYISAYRLCELCYDNRRNNPTPLSVVLVNGNNFRRSLLASLLTKFICIISLVPAGASGITAYYIITHTDNLFLAVQAIVLTIVFLFMWLNVRITLLAVPFLMAHFQQRSVFRIVIYSFRFMRGRRADIIKLFTIYSFSLVTVITAPYFLPELMTAFALSISIYVREDDYSERIKTNRKLRKPRNTGKIPYRKRRITSSAD